MEPNFEFENDTPASSTEAILEELAGGKKKPRHVQIYTHAELNVPASHKAGHRVYREVPYILVRYEARADAVARPVTERDKLMFPSVWEKYQASIHADAQAKVDLLPAAGIAVAQELRSMGLGTIPALLAYEGDLPDHLAPVMAQAKMWESLNTTESEDE